MLINFSLKKLNNSSLLHFRFMCNTESSRLINSECVCYHLPSVVLRRQIRTRPKVKFYLSSLSLSLSLCYIFLELAHNWISCQPVSQSPCRLYCAVGMQFTEHFTHLKCHITARFCIKLQISFIQLSNFFLLALYCTCQLHCGIFK